MGCYKVRRENLMTAWQIQAAEAVFRGKSNKEIAIEVLHINPADEVEMKKAVKKIKALLMTKKFEAYYKSIVTEWTVHNVGRALNKLSEQIDHDQPWLANKAANDILQRAPKSFLQSEDETTLKIVVEGAPTLGTPDDEGCEG